MSHTQTPGAAHLQAVSALAHGSPGVVVVLEVSAATLYKASKRNRASFASTPEHVPAMLLEDTVEAITHGAVTHGR